MPADAGIAPPPWAPPSCARRTGGGGGQAAHLKLGATSRGTELLLTQKRDESGLGEAGGARAGLSRKRGGAGPGGIMAEAEGESLESWLSE